jgi:K+-transporting ATPase ATPase A chain
MPDLIYVAAVRVFSWACAGYVGAGARLEQRVTEQTIVQGPMPSQVAIKMLGTNGGGYANPNAAHPFENPTPLSNFVQMLSILAIGSGLTSYLGRMVKHPRHGWTVWAAMALLLVGALSFLPALTLGPVVEHFLTRQGTLF